MNNVTKKTYYVLIFLVLLRSVHWNKIPANDKSGDFELLLDEELYQNSDHSVTHRGKNSDRHSAPRWK